MRACNVDTLNTSNDNVILDRASPTPATASEVHIQAASFCANCSVTFQNRTEKNILMINDHSTRIKKYLKSLKPPVGQRIS
jgi:hypothetical protein